MVTRTIGDRTICWRRHIWRQENLSAKGIMMRIHTDYKMGRSCSSVVSCRTETLVVNSTTNLALLIIIVRSSSILFVIGLVVFVSISKHLAIPKVESRCNLLFSAYIVHICYEYAVVSTILSCKVLFFSILRVGDGMSSLNDWLFK